MFKIFLSPPFFGFLSVVLPNWVKRTLVARYFPWEVCGWEVSHPSLWQFDWDPILLFQYDILLLSWIKHKSLFSITDSTKPFFDLPSHIGQKERARGGGTQLHLVVGRSLFSTWRSFGTRGMRRVIWLVVGTMNRSCYLYVMYGPKDAGPTNMWKGWAPGFFSILCSRLSFKKIQCLGQWFSAASKWNRCMISLARHHCQRRTQVKSALVEGCTCVRRESCVGWIRNPFFDSYSKAP